MRDLLGKVIILVAANPCSLPPDFRTLLLKIKWPAYTATTMLCDTAVGGTVHLVNKANSMHDFS